MDKETLLSRLRGKLIVSCQALEDEPLHGTAIMTAMARAAKFGGASAIRANGREDVQAIRQVTGLPVIGIVKRVYPDSEVYITPTEKEVQECLEAGADVIAMDATLRHRPKGVTLRELLRRIRENSECLAMADVSTVEEGVAAEEAGFDLVSTTLSGYTPYSRRAAGPDFELIRNLSERLSIPVIAEGRIATPQEARRAIELGAHAVVVGTAITRPHVLTRRFVEALKGECVDECHRKDK